MKLKTLPVRQYYSRFLGTRAPTKPNHHQLMGIESSLSTEQPTLMTCQDQKYIGIEFHRNGIQ